MKKCQEISNGPNYSAVATGNFSDIKEYSLIHPRTGAELHKIFLKEYIGMTGTEISIQSLGPHEEVPYFHFHIKNEETYIIIKGEGVFQVDDDCFGVSEGSVIRVAPEGKRSLANTSDTAMVYMVVQSRAGSLQEYSSADGVIRQQEKYW